MSFPNRWLILLLVAVMVKQGWFLATIPAWQVPDEPAHVAYVQALVEQHQIPIFSDQGMDVSREMLYSLTALEDSNPRRLGRHYPPGFLQAPQRTDRHLTDDDKPIRNLAARNSPMYYLFVALPYGLAYNESLENRLFTMRFFSSLLLLVTVWFSVRIAKNFSGSNWFGYTVGAVVGFHPAASLLFTGVNPDAGLTVVATIAFWLLLQPINVQRARRQVLLLALVIGVAMSIKSPGLFLIAPAIVWWILQRKKLPWRTWISLGGIGGGTFVFLGAGWLFLERILSPSAVINFFGVSNQPLSWQRILNNDLFERPAIVFRTWWGHIGWSGVSRYNQEWVYTLLTFLTFVAILCTIILLWRRQWRWSSQAFIFITGTILLEGVYQVLYWRAGLLTGATHFPIHGRYYLPLLAPLSIFFVHGLSAILPQRWRWAGYSIAVCSVVISTAVIGYQAFHLYSFERAAGWTF